MDNALSSIQQAASFSLTIFYHWFLNWRLIFYPFHCDLDRSLNTALSCYVQQAGCLLLLSLHHWFFFMLIMMTILNDTNKINVTFIKSLLISSNPPLIPGIWSLAPTSTMVRLRLQRAATESYCPTITGTIEVQPGTKQRQPATRQGQPGTKQGQPGTKQGQPGTKQGQGHNWTNAKKNTQIILKKKFWPIKI